MSVPAECPFCRHRFAVPQLSPSAGLTCPQCSRPFPGSLAVPSSAAAINPRLGILVSEPAEPAHAEPAQGAPLGIKRGEARETRGEARETRGETETASLLNRPAPGEPSAGHPPKVPPRTLPAR